MVKSAQTAPPWAPGYTYMGGPMAPIRFGFRETPEDFVVHERPAYEPCGTGEHLYLWIEKRGIGTPEAVRRIARALGVSEAGAGYAGRKDAAAVTRQWLSFAGARAEAAMGLNLDGIEVLRSDYHGNKLRLGHHAGNRFVLWLRGIAAERHADVLKTLEALRTRGLANYFGEQRFGRTGRAHDLGWLLLADDREAYVRALVSSEHAGDGAAAAELRAIIEAGERSAYRRLGRLAGALDPDLAALARQLGRRPGSLASAVRAIPKVTRRFHVNALQSLAFNAVLAARMQAGTGDRLVRGDLAQRHDSGGCFIVEDEALEAARAAALEISPTGPLPGPRMDAPVGAPGELESRVLAGLAVEPRAFGGLPGGIGARGARRALRVPIGGLEAAFEGLDLRLAFDLPKGSYATSLVEELRRRWVQPAQA